MPPAVAAIVVAAVAATAAVTSGVLQHKQAKAQAGFLEDVAQANREAERLRRRQLLARQRALMGISGFSTESTSFRQLRIEEAEQAELGALRAGLSQDYQAESLRSQGRQALVSGIFGGVSAIGKAFIGGFGGGAAGAAASSASSGSSVMGDFGAGFGSGTGRLA